MIADKQIVIDAIESRELPKTFGEFIWRMGCDLNEALIVNDNGNFEFTISLSEEICASTVSAWREAAQENK